MKSCIYVGQVRHRRFLPKPREFRYSLFMLYLDLTELNRVFQGRLFWSTSKRSLAWFKREDHFGNTNRSLEEEVRHLVTCHTGEKPSGPIRVLTHLRFFGYCFNPVSIYYCFDEAGENVKTIVAEVSNTPWGERYCYVLSEKMNIGNTTNKRYELSKQFHVSPFIDMDQMYDWRFNQPHKNLSIHMENINSRDNDKIFDATLNLQRKEITSRNLAITLLRFPFMTGKVIFLIYFQALILWLKRFPFFDHPRYSTTTTQQPSFTANKTIAKEAPKKAN